MLRAVFFAILALVLPVSAATEIKILEPKKPDGRVLIYAHGYRPVGFPNPATLDSAAYETLRDEGWIVAATSYRKTGMVVEVGANDVDQLRNLLEKKYGPIKRCILHGESMGGTIVTLLAERDPVHYQGAVAVGAALELLSKWSDPKIPLIFLTNQSELAGPQKYVSRFRAPSQKLAVWKVARDGHVNVNAPELLAAIRAVDRAIDGKKLADRDATIVPRPGKSDLTPVSGGMQTTVQTVDPVYGNFIVHVRPDDLKELSISQGSHFTMSKGKETRRVLLGKDFNDVPEGDWVAFETAEGWLRISMNFRNAAQNLGLKPGDSVVIRPAK